MRKNPFPHTLLALMVAASLAACAPLGTGGARNPSTTLGATGQPVVTGAIVEIDLSAGQEGPSVLELDVRKPNGELYSTFAGKRLRSVAGKEGSYILALPLAPGVYVMGALRSGRIESNRGTQLGIALAQLDVPLEIGPTPLAYFGRLQVQPAAPAAVVLQREDRTDSELSLARSSIAPDSAASPPDGATAAPQRLSSPLVRRVDEPMAFPPERVERPQRADRADRKERAEAAERMERASRFLATPPVPAREVSATPADGNVTLNVYPADSSAAVLLDPAVRESFASFLRSKSPRAFATDNRHASGRASGKGAEERAMAFCASKAKKASECEIFAVDDTVTSSRSK